MSKPISPCISVCKTDPETGYCYGCGRTNEEKSIWKEENTSSDWKQENLEIIKCRLSGWQLESFNKSYEFKLKNGISLNAKGRTKRPPIINRMLVKVNGPTYSIPVVCATKAVPQIKAAPTKHKVDKNCLENMKKMAPQVGFEPTTCRLTAECSTAELLRNVETNYNNLFIFQLAF